MRIAVNVVKSHQRDNAREWSRTISEGTIEPYKWEEAVAIDTSADERVEEIFVALKKLTPRLREAFVLRHMDQLKGEALAQRLGVTQASAAAMVSQAKKRLLDPLKQAGVVTK
jgi:RNA polymerase sigma factor (sigma-70 family)